MADNDSRAGIRYASPELLRWVEEVHASHDEALAATFAAPEKHDMPAIMISPSEAVLIGLLLRIIGAEKVVEVGTLAGYSAIRMARALPPEGHVWTIEYEPDYARVARRNIESAGEADKIDVVVGRGVDMLPTVEPHGPFCAVFLDADKGGYPDYGRWAVANLRRGGLLLADNVYLFGKLLEDDERGAAMRRFHREMADALETVVAPTPDGLLIGRKR